MADTLNIPKLVNPSVIKTSLLTMPSNPGIYQMLNINGEIIYIGKAKNLKKRVGNYLRIKHSRTKRMVSLVANVEYTITSSEAEAFLLESRLIKKHQPKFNILLKDDKSFPYIKLRTDHDFPQLIKYRGRNFSEGKFFGPYISSFQVDRTISELQKIFKLRSCTDNYFATRQRPCLQYQINRCTAPCTGKIDKTSYNELVKDVESFLEGKTQSLQTRLASRMEELSASMEYEKAAEVRDRIKALSYVQMRSAPQGSSVGDADVIALTQQRGFTCIQVFIYRNGQSYGNKAYFPLHAEGYDVDDAFSSFLGQFYQNKPPAKEIIVNHSLSQAEMIQEAIFQLHHIRVNIIHPKRGDKLNLIKDAYVNAENALDEYIKKQAKNLEIFDEIKHLFNLSEPPQRIEVYDNSHIMGKFAVGGMIVATPEGFDKSGYRTYTIKNTDPNRLGGDDYAMLKEVMTRRLSKVANGASNPPDLMIIDGGKGHLKIVNEVVKQFNLNIPVVAMSKGEQRNAGLEQFHMEGKESFTIDKSERVMKYLQIIRDEVHNYAINRHRMKRSKAITASTLDAIENIGEVRKKALLNHFGSYEAITQASLKDLEKIHGISKSLAKTIFDSLHA